MATTNQPDTPLLFKPLEHQIQLYLGMFSRLGEKWFDDYWMNYKKITVPDGKGGTMKIGNLKDFVIYRNGDVTKVVNQSNEEE